MVLLEIKEEIVGDKSSPFIISISIGLSSRIIISIYSS